MKLGESLDELGLNSAYILQRRTDLTLVHCIAFRLRDLTDSRSHLL
jgi:hypothetical protein